MVAADCSSADCSSGICKCCIAVCELPFVPTGMQETKFHSFWHRSNLATNAYACPTHFNHVECSLIDQQTHHKLSCCLRMHCACAAKGSGAFCTELSQADRVICDCIAVLARMSTAVEPVGKSCKSSQQQLCMPAEPPQTEIFTMPVYQYMVNSYFENKFVYLRRVCATR